MNKETELVIAKKKESPTQTNLISKAQMASLVNSINPLKKN